MAGSSYYNLTEGEKAYVKSHPWNAAQIAWDKEKAFDETVRRFARNGHNDASDAFRHCFWSALLARDIGEADAKVFTDLHESSPMNPVLEKSMDLHNNRVGISIGKNGGEDGYLSDQCYKALLQGKLRVIR